MRIFRVFALTLMLAGAIVYTAPLSFAAKKPDGAGIFSQQCSMCHGINGKGYPAIKTPDFTDPKWQAAHTDKELLSAIENGVPGTAMVSFKGKLNPQQMKAVLKYIRSLSARKKK